ncbi:MAG: YggT family protein [Betaproteobacteria bacterium]|nr:MAG: YggT family protein [Betaproteobacteria bacterium]
MFVESLQFLVRTLLGLLATAFWLRFYLQWSRVPFHHPFAQFIVRVTNFAVKPLRRVVPGLFGMDWSSLLPFLLLEFVSVSLIALLDGYPLAVATSDAWLGLLLLGLSSALGLILQTFVVLIIVQAVLSWVSSVSPASALFHALTAPILNPLRRIVPNIAGVDLSPLVAFILIQLVMMMPVTLLERSARALM